MEDITKRPIGIFDSGVGGLTVVKEILKELPKEDIVYFGDTARVPYGSKSKEVVYNFSCQIINFLLEKNVKMIIIACNTVSSNCYEELRQKFPNIPIIEVLGQGVNSAISYTKNKKIGVIGTEATIKSGRYEQKIKENLKEAKVYSRACPLFVPIVEEGCLNDNISYWVSKKYIEDFKEFDIDTLILGCTHYPLLKDSISNFVGENINIINPAIPTALTVKKYLIENNIKNLYGGKCEFFVSDKNDKFDFISSMILNKECNAEKINIEKY